MILPEEIINDIKYYTVRKNHNSPYTYENLVKNPNNDYDEVTIVFNKWRKSNMMLKFPSDLVFYTKDDGTKTVKIESNAEYLDLVNQLKAHITAVNGYAIKEPKVNINTGN